jgi:hypothetical protein
MEFLLVVLALGVFGAFVYWRMAEARKDKPTGNNSTSGGGRDGADKV